MVFAYLGINYKNAPLSIRDHSAFTDSKKIEFLQLAETLGVEQCLVLATCHRSEVFYFYDAPEQREALRRAYLALFPDVPLEDYLMELQGDDALGYLFRIAAGLESAVLGEDQILGQLKDAFALSRTLGCTRKELNRVVENAVSCAKELKTRYRFSEIPLSVSYIGIKEVQKRCGFEGKRVLMVGSGATAVLALQYVTEYPVASVTVCSRNPAHAKSVTDQFPGTVTVPYEERHRYISQSDIVISATSSPHFAIEAERCQVAGPLTFLDLAAPRDIDPKLGEVDGVQLINLDTLEAISRENQQERERLVAECSGRLNEAVAETSRWFFESRVDATIDALQQRCDEICAESYSYLDRKLDLTAREEKLLQQILRASLKKLIRDPILVLKSLDTEERQKEYTQVVDSLFALKTQ